MFGDLFFVSIEESIGFNNVIREAIVRALQYKSDIQRIAIVDDYLRKQDLYIQQCTIRQAELNLALERDPLSARTPSSDDLQRWLGKDSGVMERFFESPRDFLANLPK